MSSGGWVVHDGQAVGEPDHLEQAVDGRGRATTTKRVPESAEARSASITAASPCVSMNETSRKSSDLVRPLHALASCARRTSTVARSTSPVTATISFESAEDTLTLNS